MGPRTDREMGFFTDVWGCLATKAPEPGPGQPWQDRRLRKIPAAVTGREGRKVWEARVGNRVRFKVEKRRLGKESEELIC